ncbi:hypothetical protein SDC9_88549 [bioreactor metagenome]|uniref:Uncharacterized protein n=1 Tax=bioreactor metagenome TaxID=1076179 RepID=A0A644ZLU2_9ZZZZ
MQVDHQRFTLGKLLRRRRCTGAKGGAIPAGNLIESCKVPLRNRSFLTHGQCGNASDHRLGQVFPTTIAQCLEDGSLSYIDDSRGFAEAGHRTGILDDRKLVHQMVGVDQRPTRQCGFKLRVLIMAEISFSRIGCNPILDAQPSPAYPQLLGQAGSNQAYGILPSHRGVSAYIVG